MLRVFLVLALISYVLAQANDTQVKQPSKELQCQVSCLGEKVCRKTCSFLSELDENNLGTSIKNCIDACNSSDNCITNCVFKNVGLTQKETDSYTKLQTDLASCYNVANTEAETCVDSKPCKETDFDCILNCSDQLESPKYLSCVKNNTKSSENDIKDSETCKSSCLEKAEDLKASYLCGISCSANLFKNLNISTDGLNLTTTSNSTNSSQANKTNNSGSTGISLGFKHANLQLFVSILIGIIIFTN